MNFGFEDHHILIRDTIRDFATNEIAPQAEEIDASGRFPYEIIEGLAGLGFMGVPFPEEYGGKCFKGLKVSNAELDAINLAGDTFHGDWNYTIYPQPLDS